MVGETTVESAKREVWIDFLKVISAILIVLIHAVGYDYSHVSIKEPEWIVLLVLNVIPRCAVPIFLMITGAMLLGKHSSISHVKGNVWHFVCLCAFWNVFYLVGQKVLRGGHETLLDAVPLLLIQRGPSGHLWYSYLLIWIWLFVPSLQILYETLPEKMKMYSVLVMLGLPMVLDFYRQIFSFKGPEQAPSFQLHMTLPYIGIMIAGRLIYERMVIGRSMKFIAAALTGFLGMMAVTYIYVQQHGKATDIFISETRLFTMIYSIGVFGLFACCRDTFDHIAGRVKCVITFLAKYSLGVYFIHIIFLWKWKQLFMDKFSIISSNREVNIILVVFITYFLSVAASWLFAKIPGIRKAVV